MPVEKDTRPLRERLRDYKLEPKGEALCREAAEEIDRLRDAMRSAAMQFRAYERLHRKKGTEDGDQKAETNRFYAEKCEGALRSEEGADNG